MLSSLSFHHLPLFSCARSSFVFAPGHSSDTVQRSLPYDSPGQTFVAFEKPQGLATTGKLSNILRFIVKEIDPSTGETVDDGVEDECQLEDLDVVAADYMIKVGVSNFRNAWESMGDDCERVDEYGLGPRESYFYSLRFKEKT
ncbi:hypothetical protein L6164_000246 [Bauhinia variegata]|uniref:Uncharacterized protein n=1 Tax=Bauhinia variegata TaxID=167791 RepID=A0ACB9Q8L0_BAUVA|nr:hypothetical protein L6164_000246 [Bauhinia variegata]